MAVHLSEGDLASELDAEHDHSGDPEEENIPTSLQDGSRVELCQIVGLVWPAQSGEGPETRGEPGVKNVFVLLEGELLAGECSLGLLLSLLTSLASEPPLAIQGINLLALNLGEVDWAPVAPPQLTGDAPVVDIRHPGVEASLRRLGANLDSAVLDSSNSVVGHAAHAHVPLRLQKRLNDVLGTLTQRNGHGVILLVDVKTKLLELLLDGVTDVESLLALVLSTILVDVSIVG